MSRVSDLFLSVKIRVIFVCNMSLLIVLFGSTGSTEPRGSGERGECIGR